MIPEPASDLEATIHLVRSAQAGDRKALEALFERYLPRVRQIAALRLGRSLSHFVEDEDIAQEALLKAFQGLDRFEERTEGSFRNWLARCVECEVADQSRRRARRKRGGGRLRRFGDLGSDVLASSIFAGKSPTPSEVFQARDLETRIESALLAMPAHHREVIVLRQLCGLSYEEVAKTLGFAAAATARKACSRALERLKESLQEGG